MAAHAPPPPIPIPPPPPLSPSPPPPAAINEPPKTSLLETSSETVVTAPVRRVSTRRGRDRRSGSRRHRKAAVGGREIDST